MPATTPATGVAGAAAAAAAAGAETAVTESAFFFLYVNVSLIVVEGVYLTAFVCVCVVLSVCLFCMDS